MNNFRINECSHRRLIAFLLIISFFLLMFGNGAVSLTHPDEVFYMQTAKEMLYHHSWMTPYIFDAPQFEKPIFFFWLLAAAIKWMGMGPFAGRFWPAAFGILGVVITYWMSFLLFKNKKMAFLSAVILTSSLIYIILSRAVLTDMVFSVWVVITIALFYWGWTEPRFKHTGVLLGFVAMAAAVLTKGLLGIVFPSGVIAAYMIYKKDFSLLKLPSFWGGVMIFLALTLPWHFWMYKLYGNEFIKEYWWNVHVRRILEAEHPKSNTWYFYPGTIFAGIFPWSFFLFPTLGFIGKDWKNLVWMHDKFIFLFLWILVVFFVVQSVQSKLASYILPIFPAIAILLGYYWTIALEQSQEKRKLPAISLIAYGLSVFLILVVVASLVMAAKYSNLVKSQEPIYAFCSLSILCAVLLFLFSIHRQYHRTFVTIACVTTVVLVSLFLGRTSAEPWISCQEIAEAFKRIDHSDSTILCSKFYVRGVRFYTDRKTAVIDINGSGFFSPHPIPFLNSEAKVLDFLNSQRVTYVIVRMSTYKDLQRMTEEHFSLEELENIGDKYLLRIKKFNS